MPDSIPQAKREELTAKFKEFIRARYYKELVKAASDSECLKVDYQVLHKFNPELAELLMQEPSIVYEMSEEAIAGTELPGEILQKAQEEGEEPMVRSSFFNLPSKTNIRDLRSRNIGKFLSVEGVVRRASEIRPEIVSSKWECPDCGDIIEQPVRFGFVSKPFQCRCGNRSGFMQVGKKMIDARWITMEEPFELTEGERPSQVNVLLKDDLASPRFRRITEPGNRLIINGMLMDVPKGKSYSVKLDFYMEANHAEPTEAGWEKEEVSKEEEAEIKKLAKDPGIYRKLVSSLAPSLYGLEPEKEAIILQLFGGVHRTMEDGSSIRGDIHILLVGDPSAGKSQLLKLVPEIVPRGRYVSGKGVTGAGLTATVTKDEQFMGGWVLEAGALILTNKGILSVDEFDKMNPDDQVAMHEALEQGSVSIAKASIVATLPAKTSVLAGGNPKFSRFDPFMPIADQITIPPTLLSRFDLKFVLRDMPDHERDAKVVEHILNSREKQENARPAVDPKLIKKYIAYARERVSPEMSKEAAKMLKSFFVNTRKKAEGGTGPVPITLRQFEALMRLSEASAKIRLSDKVEKDDAQRAIKLMKASLIQLGFDPESQQIDIDMAEGGTASSERSRIRAVMEIVNELSKNKKAIAMNEIVNKAKGEGIENVEEVLDKLKREGMLFEPNVGFVQKV